MEMPSFEMIKAWIDAIVKWLDELKAVVDGINLPETKYAGYDKQF